ncbi:MAG TPA: hypothetical protein VK158_03005 [Acidobacteriota bacterium]|nr:hypothetical protein [Acidobacteriota bacterium]
MGRYKAILALLLVAVLSITAVAFAAVGDPTGSNATYQQSERGTGTSAQQINISGGNVTAVNITALAITDRWAGFYGNISGDVRLADSTGNLFYQWTTLLITDSVVYATNGTVSDWSGLNATNIGDLPSYVQTNSADGYYRTFTQQEAFTTSVRSIPSVNYTVSYKNNVSGDLKTYSMKTDNNVTLVWAGKAIEDDTGFDGTTVDFQILVPARTVQAYYFYLELP